MNAILNPRFLFRPSVLWAAVGLLSLVTLCPRANAQLPLALPIVKPVLTCPQLATADLGKAAGAPVTINSAAVTDTPKGSFCKVRGTIAPAIGFEVDLPIEHWTQRYVESGCGGFCGDIKMELKQSSSCLPALSGEFAIARGDMGHGIAPGGIPGIDASFGADPQKRIDFAYRGNHETTLVAKELIRIFYGQAPRFSYFVGCSDGGREALMEAQRYPDDFDGISAGAPAALFTAQNSFFHAWMTIANQRPDGTNILLRNRLPLLHAAIVAHCPTSSGVSDGLLEDLRACTFDPKWVQCAPTAANTSACLTEEEVHAVQRLYDGPADAKGQHFVLSGLPIGSEAQWNLPSQREGGEFNPMGAQAIKYLLLPSTGEDNQRYLNRFEISDEMFQRINELAPLYNATNTHLNPFAAHGGKLILWHGLADTSVAPSISIAYYQGVQKEMGEKQTDSFLRLFLVPGVGHCGDGEGFGQVETLSALMAWTESNIAPRKILADHVASQKIAPPEGPHGPQGGAGPHGPQTPPANYPYALPAEPSLGSRPVFPYPYVAFFTGKGDSNNPANYEPRLAPVQKPQLFNTKATALIGPDNQKQYTVVNGKLTVIHP